MPSMSNVLPFHRSTCGSPLSRLLVLLSGTLFNGNSTSYLLNYRYPMAAVGMQECFFSFTPTDSGLWCAWTLHPLHR